MERYQQIEHTADLGARIYGSTIEDIFVNSAFAMTDIGWDIPAGGRDCLVEIEIEGADLEDLLVKWLNEILYYSFKENAVFFVFSVKHISSRVLKAGIQGKHVEDMSGYEKKEIKAATYHGIDIHKVGMRYEVEIVFDI